MLISGAGVAGPTLAYWLVHHGFEATIVEKAPQLRSGGYIVDFWGSGYDIAERMGLIPELEAVGYHVRELRLVDRDGKRVGGFEISALDALLKGRFMSLPRSELAAAVYRRIAGSVETIFGDEIVAIDRDDRTAHVRFAHGAARDFDLVVGADGLHSKVRELVFGPQSDFEIYLGYKVAAAEVVGYQPREELVYVVYSPVGSQVGRFAQKSDRTLFLFVWSEDDREVPPADTQLEMLRAKFGDSGWECRAIVDAIDASHELYFDRVSQIRMPRWAEGRVALVGDAAFCISLIGGQGSALAMLGAYVLAGELKAAAGDHAVAFAAYEHRLAAFIAGKQKAAARFARSFVPRSAFRRALRNQVTKLLRVPGVARLAFGRTMVDKLQLPDY